MHNEGNNIFHLYKFVKDKLNIFKTEPVVATNNLEGNSQNQSNEAKTTYHTNIPRIKLNFSEQQNSIKNQDISNLYSEIKPFSNEVSVKYNFNSSENYPDFHSNKNTIGDGEHFIDDISDIYSGIYSSEKSSEFNDIMTTRNIYSSSVRGISISNALELIPRYSGTNINLNTFIDGVNEAVSLLGDEYESQILRMINIKLSEEAKKCVTGQIFYTISELEDFLENIFGLINLSRIN